MPNKLALSIVIPAYNEEKRLGPTLSKYLKKFEISFGNSFEILVVMNGCKDQTEKVIQKYQKTYNQLKYINISEAIGKGGALTEGFKIAEAEIVGFTDADGSTSPATFFKLYKIINTLSHIDCVIGSRNLPGSVVKGRTGGRKIMTSGFNFGVNFLFRLDIKDTQCGAKLVRRKILKKIVDQLTIANMAFDVNLLVDIKREKGEILEIPILWTDSEESSVKSPVKTSVAMAIAVFRLRIIYSLFNFMYPFLNWLMRPVYEILLNDRQKNTYEKWKKVNPQKTIHLSKG